MIKSGETPSGWIGQICDLSWNFNLEKPNQTTQNQKCNSVDKQIKFHGGYCHTKWLHFSIKSKINTIKAYFLCLPASSLQACSNVNFYSNSVLWIDATSQTHKCPFKSMHKNEAERFQEVKVIMCTHQWSKTKLIELCLWFYFFCKELSNVGSRRIFICL